MYEWLNNPETIDPTFSHLPPHERQAILATLRAAKDASTTTSPTAAGFKKAIRAITTPTLEINPITAEQRRLRALKRIEAELRQCDGCTGVCRKTFFKYSQPIADETAYGVIEVSSKRCIYGRQRDFEKSVRSSKIPDRYIGKTLEDYACDAHNRNAVEYAKQASKLNCGAYFYGECGCGKTFLASIIAQEFLRNGDSVLFVKVPSLLDDIKATFGGQGSELTILEDIKATKLVVLDDFGMEKPTQWAGATLSKILDMRYDGRSMTLITSNLSPKELADRLSNASDGANLNGSRIFDRLKEICKPILLKGTSRRN